MHDKIKDSHLERSAYVYVRQSTTHQVREHQESRRRQYALADRARELGFGSVIVVDQDLGISGTGSRDRPGFGRLLTAVCQGEVGAVFALEASRLARNSRDWHHLIDLCAMTDTLLIDHDGVYDPQRLNDRLLLGLKGTMSEFELGLLRQRAQEALHQMIQRGEVLGELPAGYVRTSENQCEMTPDRQVQDAIRGLFAKFREMGSARQVMLWYRQEQLPLPTSVLATAGREVVWKLPVYGRIISILKNPVYAGAFVHGRTRSRSIVVDGRGRTTRGHSVAQHQWQVLIRDHHVGYISWEDYQQNQLLLKANSGMKSQIKSGAAKRGLGLLAGLLECSRCGRRLHVSYSGNNGRIIRYHCRGARINHGSESCISFGGMKVDEAVAALVLKVLAPAGIEATLQECGDVYRNEDEKRRTLELATEKARYEAARARRQFDAVEPENRLVAAELEKRWNESLRLLADIEARLQEVEQSQRQIGEREKVRLLELGQDLEVAWNHPDAPVTLKKRILRSMIDGIIAGITDDPPRVMLTIRWAGGVHTAMQVSKNRSGEHRRSTDREVVELVRELSRICEDRYIVLTLNRLGYRTGAGHTWTEARVRSLRSYHEIIAFDSQLERTWLTLEKAAKELNVANSFVRRLLAERILPGRQVVAYSPWIIERQSLDLPEVRQAVEALKRDGRFSRPNNAQNEMLLFSIA